MPKNTNNGQLQVYKQGVALTGHNHTGPLCSAGHLTAQAPSPVAADCPRARPTHRQRYRRRQQTTGTSEQNNTDPLGGPVIN